MDFPLKSCGKISIRLLPLITLATLCFCMPLFLGAQRIIKPEVINYPKNAYNAEGQNWSVTQDENRILYFGNNKGLLVFDGEEWKLYTLPKQQIIRSVAADKKGKIYTGAFGEFGYWQKDAYSAYRYHSLDYLIKDSLFKEEEIWKIIASPDEVLFQSFSRIYILRNGQVKRIVAPGTVMFTFAVRGRFYAGVLGKGVYTLDDNYSLVPLTADNLINDDKVTFILPYSIDEMLIGTEKSGLFLYDGRRYQPFSCDADVYFKSNEVNNGVQLNENLYAIGTISGGLILMDANGKTISKIDRSFGLQNNTVLNIYKDADDNCWLALDRGITQLVLNSNIEYFRDLQGVIGTVYSIAVFGQHIYVATNHGLFYAPFSSLAGFDENTLMRFGNIASQVWDLKVIDHRLFCSYNSGTLEINAAGNAHVLMDSTGCWDMEKVKGDSAVLLQGTYYGVAVYRKMAGEWRFANFMSGTENMPINKLRIDDAGLLWVHHAYKGIFVIKPSGDYRKAVTIKELADAVNAPQNIGLSFFESGGNVYINGKSGIYTYDFATNTLHYADVFRKLLGPYFYSRTIIPDSTKGFWLINNDNGVAYKNSQTSELQTFAFNEKLFGLVSGSEKIIPYSVFQSFICGEEGFAVINRNGYNNSRAYNAPSVTAIQVDVKGRYHDIDSTYFDGADRIVLPYSRNSIVIHFSALSYDKNAQYSYSLSSGDTLSWSEWTRNPVKEFANLSPGKYIFRLKSTLSDDVCQLYIYVASPWYWSTFTKILYVLLLGLIIYLMVQWHRHRLAKQQLALTKRMKEAVALQRQKSENEILLLRQAQLSEEVVHKSEDLAKLAMDLIKKKNVIKKLKDNLEAVKNDNNVSDLQAHIQKISKSLDKHLKDEENEWHLFDNGFNKVHEEFFDRLLKKYPELTAQDLRLAAYLRMNLSTKEIAPLLNISTRGVEIKRYRLRKKIRLEEQENLNDFMIRF